MWGDDLADMKLLSKCNKTFSFLLCVIDIFSKYAWVIPLKDNKCSPIVNVFQSILNDSERKPNKIWVHENSEFYDKYFKTWLHNNDMKMYSTHNI